MRFFHPFEPAAPIVLKKVAGDQRIIEFRIPSHSFRTSVDVNGDAVTPVLNERGFYKVERDWAGRGAFEMGLDRQLDSHVTRGGADVEWVSFSYGPWTLARAGSRSQCRSQAI